MQRINVNVGVSTVNGNINCSDTRLNNNNSEFQVGGNLNSPIDFKSVASTLTFNGTNGPYNFNGLVNNASKGTYKCSS